MLGKLDSYMQKNETIPLSQTVLLYAYYTSVFYEAIKYIEENKGEAPYDTSFHTSKIFITLKKVIHSERS